jgi:hypothetical protein
MADIIINVDTDKIQKEKHICWYVTEYWEGERKFYRLMEVVERYYIHPDSNGHALIQNIETILCREVPESDIKFKAYIPLLQMAQDNVSQVEELKEGW